MDTISTYNPTDLSIDPSATSTLPLTRLTPAPGCLEGFWGPGLGWKTLELGPKWPHATGCLPSDPILKKVSQTDCPVSYTVAKTTEYEVDCVTTRISICCPIQHTFKFGHTVTSRITDVFTPEACVATRLNLPDSPPWTITVTAPTTWLGAINNEPYISYTRTFDPAHDYLVAEEVEITQYITAETVTECSPWVTAVATKTISSDSSFSTANGTPSITVIDVSSESSPNRLNSGQIAGLIVGSVAGFLLGLLGCAYFFGKIWRNRVNRNVARRERTRIVIDLADISRPETPPPPYEVAVGMRPSSREQ